MANKYKIVLIALAMTSSCVALKAQTEDLEKLLDAGNKPQKQYVHNAFKSPRVINGHSMEMLGKGVLDFRILHRFGTLSGGYHELFGLDQASMRFGFDYGISKNFSVGVGRSTFNKEVDGFLKCRIVQQSKGPGSFPVSVLWVSGMTMKTAKESDAIRAKMENRLGYYHQVILGRKFGTAFTLQLSPTLVHRNLVDSKADKNNMVALGIGGRIKLSNRSALILDTYPFLYGGRSGYNRIPLSIGFDIETGGHVFQLHITNTRGMNEKAFIAETTERWGKGDIRIGFNLSRVFTVVKNKEASW
jgi:Membrane bound beta barrel domain (DUF5777)